MLSHSLSTAGRTSTVFICRLRSIERETDCSSKAVDDPAKTQQANSRLGLNNLCHCLLKGRGGQVNC